MRKVILYKFNNAWSGGFILSRPISFPTKLFKDEGIEFEHYEEGKQYSDKDIFFCNWGEYFQDNLKEKFKDRLLIIGGPEAYANEWVKEHKINDTTLFLYSNIKNENLANAIFIEKFWWYTSYFSYTTPDNIPLYNFDVNQSTYEKKFLMQIRTVFGREWRLEIYGALVDHLDDSYVSRMDLNIGIDDLQNNSPYDLYKLMSIQPEWFQKSHFSIILETYIDNVNPFFFTEKTFKTLAHGHPYLLVSRSESLSCLKQWGFQSFENIFDESYDELYYRSSNWKDKLKILKKNVDLYDYSKPYDDLTKEKIIHNRELFFNKKVVEENYKKEILEPVAHWIKTR